VTGEDLTIARQHLGFIAYNQRHAKRSPSQTLIHAQDWSIHGKRTPRLPRLHADNNDE